MTDTSPTHRDVIPIVALDTATLDDARRVVGALGEQCGFYKVGLELFAADGPAAVRWLRDAGKRVFVDLKLHDIPNTVRGAAASVARTGAALLTVHASGGAEMIRAAVEGARAGAERAGTPGCDVLAVTVLTSHDAASLGATWGRDRLDVAREVMRLAEIAHDGGAAGIVCSGLEAAAVTRRFGGALRPLVPGIRLAGGDAHDQRRTVTPGEARAAGARWIVVGRAVTATPDPAAAMREIHADLARRREPNGLDSGT